MEKIYFINIMEYYSMYKGINCQDMLQHGRISRALFWIITASLEDQHCMVLIMSNSIQNRNKPVEIGSRWIVAEMGGANENPVSETVSQWWLNSPLNLLKGPELIVFMIWTYLLMCKSHHSKYITLWMKGDLQWSRRKTWMWQF